MWTLVTVLAVRLVIFVVLAGVVGGVAYLVMFRLKRRGQWEPVRDTVVSVAKQLEARRSDSHRNDR